MAIPYGVLVPPIFAFGANIVSGVTNFGDGVFFIICWTLWGRFGPVDPDDKCQPNDKCWYLDAILFSSMLPLASIPALVAAAREEMWITVAYGTALSSTSIFSSVLGVYFLLFVNPDVTMLVAGLLFCAFTVYKLVPAVLVLGLNKAKANGNLAARFPELGLNEAAMADTGGGGGGETGNPVRASVELGGFTGGPRPKSGSLPKADLDRRSVEQAEAAAATAKSAPLSLSAEKEGEAPAPLELDETGTVVLGGGDRHWLCMAPLFKKHPTLKATVERWLPQISETLVPVETVFFGLLLCGVASGFLGGLIGTGSPAQLIAFSTFEMTKGSMRGVKVLATIVSNIIRLAAIIFSSKDVFEASKWPVYVAVCVCSLAGCTLGTWLRTYVNKEWLMVCLYWLLWFTSASLLGVLDRVASPVAAAYYLASGALMVVTLACYCRPHMVENCLGGIPTACAAKASQPSAQAAGAGEERFSTARNSRYSSRNTESGGLVVRQSIVRDLDEWE